MRFSRIVWEIRNLDAALFLDNNLMNEEVLLNQLEELAEKLEILVRDENINIEELSCSGGLCRVEGKYVIILNSKTAVKEKIQVMIEALNQFDLSDMYIKPVIRELLVLSIFLCKIFIGQFFKERQIFTHFSHRV
jgi:hypothetical protein